MYSYKLSNPPPGETPIFNAARAPRIEWMRPLQSCLTCKDYTLLEGHLLNLGSSGKEDPLLARLIRTKLADTRVVLSDDVAPDVATANSRIVLREEDAPESEKVLVHWDHECTNSFALPICSLLGTTLLGMRAGERAALLRDDGTVSSVELLRVDFQPEAARRATMRQGSLRSFDGGHGHG